MLKAFAIRNNIRMTTITASIQYCTGPSLCCKELGPVQYWKNIYGLELKNELFLVVYMIAYVENPIFMNYWN